MKQVFDLVIFGGTGDLSMRKLLPAMYRAYHQGHCSEDSRILVCCRKPSDFEVLPERIEEALKTFLDAEEFDSSRCNAFMSIVEPVMLDLTNLEQGWTQFSDLFEGREEYIRLFYLAVMPSIYGACCENLSTKNLITPNSRIVVEKPLGYDLDSAEKINETMARYFQEEQIYRIDHYLGKETVQNLLALRFGNFLFENIWDSKAIEHIQISISEQVGLEGRAGFYDEAGAMRDMVQNHLLQLLCLVAMESPNKLRAEDVRVEKIKVLRALKPILPEDMESSVVRGQYVSGQIDGEKVPGYLDELESYQSNTETYVAIKTFIENWRWAGVPFYLRTGKRLKKRSAEIIVQFKNVTHNVYGSKEKNLEPNRLIIQLQPEEKIQLVLMAKAIGEHGEKKSENEDLSSSLESKENLKPITLNLDFSQESIPFKSSAYQRLLIDAIHGNSTLFIHRDEVRAAWKWVDPIIESWKSSAVPPEFYSAGSWGPTKANELFEKREQSWINIAENKTSTGKSK
ncbi:glucose-6-phosphate dehydrogenase [Aliikangiella coralliicola]|uniref:Glucose-6-phosphate 1-dehydrogenase n=1 Tax=Aliikangiella coralliicola TaxID=2592383 RepID=A0A545UJP7_9GAMM|nr:glucose-6-phosphate dehydrogenase [Aliikangiella coralliicola]TQV89689.1 glucose-6-phosphate dehydrogenase [Aliikangiella coralliicola]